MKYGVADLMKAVVVVLLGLLYLGWQEYAELKTKLDEANKQIAIANQRETRVKVSFRKGFIDSGYVATFTNTYNQPVVITADFERPSSAKKRSAEMTFDPGQSKEIGESEGWAFVSGDTVTVNQDNHKSITFALQ